MTFAPDRPAPSPGHQTSGRALRLAGKARTIQDFAGAVEPAAFHRQNADQVVIAVRAAAVNQSDAKAALGVMPQAVWPRTPGRDFAGIVADGPADLMGREVWGTGGDLGITRDGSHATHLILDAGAVSLKPRGVPLLEAGGLGVPFVTASEGFARAGAPQRGETVVVMGVNGKVGQAATQIATMHGARVIGVTRRAEGYVGHASSAVEVIDSSSEDVAARVRALTGGHGADLVFNTVGSPYFEASQDALALDGRQILMASLDKVVPLRILDFYHGRHSYFGIDSLGLDAMACARRLDALAPGFESGALRPFAVETYGLSEARAAYTAALSGARTRVVIVPGA